VRTDDMLNALMDKPPRLGGKLILSPPAKGGDTSPDGITTPVLRRRSTLRDSFCALLPQFCAPVVPQFDQ
ncbi:MAG: hypothetical protein ACRD6W_15565, partial [Nitrososphaerales archaeon]